MNIYRLYLTIESGSTNMNHPNLLLIAKEILTHQDVAGLLNEQLLSILVVKVLLNTRR